MTWLLIAAAAIFLLTAAAVPLTDTLRARRRHRAAHRSADVWLDPRSLSYSRREPRP